MDKRKDLVREKVEEEDFMDMMQLRGVRQIVRDRLLKEKGFKEDEIIIEPKFDLVLSDCKASVSIDFAVSLPEGIFAVIRCANSGLEFWERYVTAFARVVNKNYQIPFAVVTNSDSAKIIDVLSGNIKSEEFKDFPTRQEAIDFMAKFEKMPYSEKKIEREKRIVYAFEDVKRSAAGVVK